ncbi:MAG TPA: RNA polymerase sigma factor [Armatimonadaceae bacterium]|jgi:RNA polymerase sigma-70 factor (ECF subfamily)|nr:RNA polymerase sigma factor [Armatimonadaceae bacterium]
MTQEERECLERFRRGEPGAFDDLYAQYGPRIYRFCLRLCGGAVADAEDLTQEVFLAAHGSLHRFEGRSSLSTYLYRISIYCRRQARSRAGDPQRICRGDEEHGAATPASHAGGEDPARTALARLTLTAALDRLSEAQRTAFLLVKAEGFTCREAAEALDLPVGTVKYQVFEAVARLRTLLEEAGYAV